MFDRNDTICLHWFPLIRELIVYSFGVVWLLGKHPPKDCTTIDLRAAPQRLKLVLVQDIAGVA